MVQHSGAGFLPHLFCCPHLPSASTWRTVKRFCYRGLVSHLRRLLWRDLAGSYFYHDLRDTHFTKLSVSHEGLIFCSHVLAARQKNQLKFAIALFVFMWLFLSGQTIYICEKNQPYDNWQDLPTVQCNLGDAFAIAQLVCTLLDRPIV